MAIRVPEFPSTTFLFNSESMYRYTIIIAIAKLLPFAAIFAVVGEAVYSSQSVPAAVAAAIAAVGFATGILWRLHRALGRIERLLSFVIPRHGFLLNDHGRRLYEIDGKEEGTYEEKL